MSMKFETMRPDELIQPEEAKRLASMKAPKPAESGVVPDKEKMPSMGERLTQDYAIRARMNDSGAYDAFVRVLERARDEYVTGQGEAKNVPTTAVLANRLLGRIRPMVDQKNPPAELYADILDMVTDEIRKTGQNEHAA